ncbi:MAG: hypothetical protein ACI88H_002042 [Cocleimonas sp.]|jgi:hypothetical protein
MKRAESLITTGGQNFSQTHQVDAERHYREVIYTLEKKLSSDPKCVDSIKGWISSYHNLAAVYQHRGELALAQKCLLIPHHSMLYMADYKQNDEELELIAIKAIKLTLPPLLEFAKSHPPCAKCLKELRSHLVYTEKDDETYH